MATDCKEICPFLAHCEAVAGGPSVEDSQQTPIGNKLGQPGTVHGDTRVEIATGVVVTMGAVTCPVEHPDTYDPAACAAFGVANQIVTETAVGFNRFA